MACDIFKKKRNGANTMKKWIAIMSVLFLILAAASAEGYVYSMTSVTDCAQTDKLYTRFYESGELSVLIPGLAEGIVPQGISYLPEENCLLFAGYRSDKGNSALLAVSLESGELVKEVILCLPDGTPYNGHAGGVCVTEKNIYISNAYMLLRISLDTFRALPASSECRIEEAIPVPVRSSYGCYSEGILWVGEFEYGAEYKTDTSHRVKTADGRFKAWTCGYILTSETENELKPEALENGGDAVPDYLLSMTERIQGFTTKEGKIYLSQSYGRRAVSLIYRYDNVLKRTPDAEGIVSGVSVPMWFLDKNALEETLLTPPMSECLCTVDDAIYVVFESAAQAYMAPGNASQNPIDRAFKLTGF